MNKRIKELADQSNAWYPEGYPSGEGGDEAWKNNVIFNKQDLEKFAELILQDIDKIVDELYHTLPLEQAAVLLILDENIKEHFYGVE